MNEMPECPRCGSLLPDGSPLGRCPACLLERGLEGPTERSAEIPPGAVLGAYEVRRLLGRGGMGEVYLAGCIHDGSRTGCEGVVQ